MAAFALTDTSIYVGPLDESCFGNSVEVTRAGDVVESTTFCSGGWREYVPGLKTWGASFGGPQDFAASTASTTYTPDEVYLLTAGSTYPLTIAPSGAAQGSIAYGSNGVLASYKPLGSAVGALAEHNVAFVPSGNTPLVRGVLAAKQTVTAPGTAYGPANLLTAVSATQRVYAGLHVLTRGGTGTLTVELISDDNSGFTSPTTRATFAAVSSRTSEWISVAGAITDTYWGLSYTVGGGSPSFQVRGFIGII